MKIVHLILFGLLAVAAHNTRAYEETNAPPSAVAEDVCVNVPLTPQDIQAAARTNKAAAAQAYELGISQGLQHACTTLDPIGEAPFFIFEELEIPWATLVPNLTLAYGLEPVKPWTVPAVCGTFPINGDRPPAGEVKFDGERLRFSKPGEYILRAQSNDASGDGGGGFQCCWTNVYVKVTVTP